MEKIEEQKSISSLLLPREKYAEMMKQWGELPHFEIEKEGQVLYYFGANHSPDPDNEQYPKLEEYWGKFLESTKEQDRIVLVEGGLRPLMKDEESAITRGVEGGFITLLAHRANVPVACPDLNRDEEFLKRLPNISKEEILLHWFLSIVDNFHRIPDPKPDFEKVAEAWCAHQRQMGTWKDIDVSLSNLKELYKKILGKEFDENENPNDLVNPNNNGTPINKVARVQSDLRDTNVVSEIVRYWKEGKSIFVVFGSGHLAIEEPALKFLLK